MSSVATFFFPNYSFAVAATAAAAAAVG